MQPFKQLARWNRDLSRVIGVLGEHDFFPHLLAAIKSQVAFDSPWIWLFRNKRPPRLLYGDTSSTASWASLNRYIEGAYEDDPFYQVCHRPKTRIYRLSQLAGSKLTETRYYQEFHGALNIIDKVAYFNRLTPDIAICLSLMRCNSSKPFSDDEFAHLSALADPVSELLSIQCQHKHFSIEHLIQPDIDRQIKQAFDSFGSSILSPREKDVLNMMLHGYNTTASAKKLNLAIETVRRHRKGIYRKLDVNSQTALFSLFINAMSCLAEACEEDPLLIYLSPRNRH
ncbi:MAG: response regulator transcription factor [Parahaliea sp.]